MEATRILPFIGRSFSQAGDTRILDLKSNYEKGAIVNRVNRQLHLVVGLDPKI